MRRLFLLAARPMFHLQIEGAERVPATGPAILVAFHRSWLDPPLIGAVCRRPVHFLILDSVYHRPAARWFYRAMRTIPVPADPMKAAGALRRALRRLQRGQLIGIFPEGRVFTQDEPGKFRPGVALLALRSAAPVVPIGVDGSERAWPHGERWPRPAPVRVRVGTPIVTAGGGRGSRRGAAIRDLTQRIERGIAELVDSENVERRS